MEYNHNGTLLVTGSTDGHVRVYDTVSLDCVVGWEAHSGPVDSVTFSEDETRILSIGGEGKVSVYTYFLIVWSACNILTTHPRTLTHSHSLSFSFTPTPTPTC